MKKIFKFLPVLCIAFILSGCWSQNFKISDAESFVEKDREHQVFVFWGIGQHKHFKASTACDGDADKIARIETRQPPLGIIVGVVTFGIITFYEYAVSCEV